MNSTLFPVSRLRGRLLTAFTLVATVTVLAACGSVPEAPPQLAVAEAAVQRANTPTTMADAPAQLRVATDKLAAARAAVTAGDTPRARMLSEQAEVDARVAELHADSMRSGKAAKESQDAARALSEEIQRKPAR